MTDQQRQTTSSVEAAFLKWFRQSGGTLDARCRTQPIPGMGRGMVAQQPIKAGETLFSIPRHVLLNLSTSSLASRCLQAEQDTSNTETSQAAFTWSQISKLGWLPLILAMMFERRRAACETTSQSSGDVSMEDVTPNANGANDTAKLEGVKPDSGASCNQNAPQQTWDAYFDIMPTEFTTPMFWSESDLQHLQGTSIADKIARTEAEQDYFDKALPFIKSRSDVFLDGDSTETMESELKKWYGLDTYHVMGSRILSRSFHVKSPKSAKDGMSVDMDSAQSDDDDEEEEAIGEVLDDEGEAEVEVEEPSKLPTGNNQEEEEDDAEDANISKDDSDVDSSSSSDSEDDDSSEDGEESEDVSDISMTPMADMLNARYESDNARLFYKSSVLEMRATKDIAAGSQIFNTYADPPNSDLLRRYGHVDEPNGGDVVELSSRYVLRATLDLLRSKLLPKTQSDDDKEVQHLKKDLEARLEWACSSLGIEEVFILNYLFTPSPTPPHRLTPEVPTSKQLKSAAIGGGISEEMIALARILAMPRDAFEKAKAKGKGPSARVDAVEGHSSSGSKSGKVKIPVPKILVDAIDLKLKEYPNGSNVKEEETLLYGSRSQSNNSNNNNNAAEINQNLRNALVVRLGEKRVLLDQRRVLKFVLDKINEVENKSSTTSSSSSTSAGGNKRKSNGHQNNSNNMQNGKKKSRR